MNFLLDIRPISWIKAMVYGLLLSGIYYSTFTWLIEEDWPREDYTYCYLIPFVVLYLIWEKRGGLAELLSLSSWRGLIPFCLGLILFWLGELSGEFFSLYLSFWFMIIGLCWLSLGWAKIKTILFALVFSITMFPLPHFVNNKITVYFKLISSKLGVDIMRLMGMSAYREGNVIDLGFTQLQVVDACSGLRYFFPLIILGILLAYFFKASWWKKTVLIISTAPISIVVNSLRIVSVGILYQLWGQKVAEGFFHDFSGWFIFMISLGVLLLEMWGLKKVPGSRFTVQGEGQTDKKHPQITQISAEVSVEKNQNSKPKIKNFFSPPQFIVAVILLGATLTLSQGVEFREKIPINKSFDQFPMQVGGWSGTSGSLDQRFIDKLDLSDYVIVDYKDRHNRNVNFYVAYYESQRKGESIHSPATCLPGSGWAFHVAGKTEFPIPGHIDGPMSVNLAFMKKVDNKKISYY